MKEFASDHLRVLLLYTCPCCPQLLVTSSHLKKASQIWHACAAPCSLAHVVSPCATLSCMGAQGRLCSIADTGTRACLPSAVPSAVLPSGATFGCALSAQQLHMGGDAGHPVGAHQGNEIRRSPLWYAGAHCGTSGHLHK
eukprot:1148407-Pelagomonas_calceolata.AAC.6